jgi:ubiquinone/menaquinone biosynthesis C-methylase UbiE
LASGVRDFARELCPPLVWRGLSRLRGRLRPQNGKASPDGQDLAVYWDPEMAQILETWGEGNAWSEIQLLMSTHAGRVLDIACGTGKTIDLLRRFPELEVHGCDISDMLIGKAIERGIPPDRLTVTDATAMSYPDGSFDWAYTIGSLEHFTEDGILKLLAECRRVVRKSTFHMIPVARSGRDEGWIKTLQSYHNNSVAWWDKKCRAVYPNVQILDSSWSDRISVGKWLICSP